MVANPSESGDVGPDRVHQSIDVVVAAVAVDGHEHVDVGIGEQPAELVAGRERADRHGDRPDARHREPGDDEVDAGREEDGHVGSPARADRHQAPGELARATFGVGVGEPIVVADQHGRLTAGGDLGGELLTDRARHRRFRSVTSGKMSDFSSQRQGVAPGSLTGLRVRDGGHVAPRSGSRSREKPELIADELRALIVSGELADGASLGREPDLVERFGVSRPSLREALRILEAEGLITVVRGVLGGVIVHHPDERMTARTAALVLQSRNVTLGDVHQARSAIEPACVRILAESPRRAMIKELTELVEEQRRVVDDPEEFGQANARFHERLVELTGNQTLSIVAEMLNEIVARAVTAVSHSPAPTPPRSTSAASGRRNA